MKRYNKASTAYPHLQKEADRVKKLLAVIEKAQSEIREIQDGENWLNYTPSSFNDLSEEESINFYRLEEFVKYANR